MPVEPRIMQFAGTTAYDTPNTVDAARHPPHARSHVEPQVASIVVNDPVLQLTEGQRDCLRLVFGHMTSKDIARALDISPHTVDMRLRTAMRTLGVASRIEAARLLVDSEGGQSVYQPLIYQSPDVAGTIGGVSSDGPASTPPDDLADRQFSSGSKPEFGPPAGGPPRPAGASMNIDVVNSNDAIGSSTVGSRSLPSSPEALPWGRRNTLGPGARIAWIAGIAFGSAIAFGAIVSALEALKNLL